MKTARLFGLFSPGAAGAQTMAMMFCLGLNAMLAQLVLTRELMVAFYGNELAIGIIFAVWLVTVSIGSLIIRPFLSGLSENSVRLMAMVLLTALAVLLPLLIFAARALRIFFHVPIGEYMALGQMVGGALLVLAPVCLIVGIIFPGACRLAELRSNSVAGIYATESAGGMMAGIAFSFIFVFLLPPMGIAFFAALCAVCGAALIAPRVSMRKTYAVIAVCLVGLLLFPWPIKTLETAGIKLRWQAFAILPRGGVEYLTGNPRLLASRDSRYQNLTLIEQEGQKTLYGNGQAIFVFPDTISAEKKISFIMAQNPDARRVLLIGGNPVNDIPELLKYPLAFLAQVELDALINRLLADTGGDEYHRALADPRLRQYLMDGPRFVKNSREKFDLVIVEAPEPTTIALNRFYTVEFYRDIARRLAPGGFLYTAVNASEELQNETADMTASVYRALQAVFPRLLVTAGTRNQFFAGKNDAPLTFAGKTLYERWRRAGIRTEFFRPEFFLNADEISAEKNDFVHRRLASVSVPANSALRPVSAFYNLLLWSRYSGSRLQWFFNAARHLRIEWIFSAIAATAILLLLYVITPFRRKNIRAFERSERLVVVAVIGATGFAGMALELILIFMFQTLLGYVYASIGIIMAMFMLGLAWGAFSVHKDLFAGTARRWRLLLEADAILLLIALGLPFLMEHDWGRSATWPVAGTIYLLTLLTGWAGGAQFILATALLNEKKNDADYCPPPAEHPGSAEARLCEGASAMAKRGARIPRNAALLNAVDLAGAALGGASIGIICLPLFGFDGTCHLLALIKAGTILLTGFFLILCPRGVAR